jgi:hypothetical protein
MVSWALPRRTILIQAGDGKDSDCGKKRQPGMAANWQVRCAETHVKVAQSHRINVPRVQIRNGSGDRAGDESQPRDADQNGPSFAWRWHGPEEPAAHAQRNEQENSANRKVDQRDIERYVAHSGGSVDIDAARPMLCSDRGVQPVQALEIKALGRSETETQLHGVTVARGVLASDADVVGEVPVICRDCHVERRVGCVGDPFATRIQTCRVEAARQQERALERSYEMKATHGPSVPGVAVAPQGAGIKVWWQLDDESVKSACRRSRPSRDVTTCKSAASAWAPKAPDRRAG